MSTPVGA
jgi:hypothetical protein